MINDIINGSFELIGAIVSWFNVFRIYKDKCVMGIYWPTSLFFSVWGLWNLYYYSTLNQWYSVLGGITMVSANIAWVSLAIKYKTK